MTSWLPRGQLSRGLFFSLRSRRIIRKKTGLLVVYPVSYKCMKFAIKFSFNSPMLSPCHFLWFCSVLGLLDAVQVFSWAAGFSAPKSLIISVVERCFSKTRTLRHLKYMLKSVVSLGYLCLNQHFSNTTLHSADFCQLVLQCLHYAWEWYEGRSWTTEMFESSFRYCVSCPFVVSARRYFYSSTGRPSSVFEAAWRT